MCISHIFLLGTIPGPIIFGVTIDSTCILWDINECGIKGACWIYDNIKMARMLVTISKWWFLDNFRVNWWCPEENKSYCYLLRFWHLQSTLLGYLTVLKQRSVIIACYEKLNLKKEENNILAFITSLIT